MSVETTYLLLNLSRNFVNFKVARLISDEVIKFFSIYLILSVALGKKCFWGVMRGRRMGLKTSPPFESRLSRQCGILNISQPYRPPRYVTGTALLLLFFQFYIHTCNEIGKRNHIYVWITIIPLLLNS
jgi:hypothetical protein